MFCLSSDACLPSCLPALQNLGGWAVAALCRSMSLDNLLTFLTAALLERQVRLWWAGRALMHAGSMLCLSLSVQLVLTLHALPSPVPPASQRLLTVSRHH